jgi:hypothetical protein
MDGCVSDDSDDATLFNFFFDFWGFFVMFLFYNDFMGFNKLCMYRLPL